MAVSHAGQFETLGYRNIVGNFYRSYEADLGQTWAPRISFLNSEANQPIETYPMVGDAPFPREWKGGRKIDTLDVFEVQIRNVQFEGTLRVKLNDLRRAKTPQINMRIAALSASFTDHWNELVSALARTNGTTGVYDGQNFFDTDHSIGSSGAINNAVTASEVGALNVATAASPSPTEAANALIGCVQHMYGFKGAKGQPVNGGARRFICVVPVNLWGSFMAAARSERLSGGESNFLVNQEFSIEVVPDSRLTSTTQFYLYRVDGSAKPFILQEEAGVQMEVLGEGTEHAFKHNEALFGAKALRNAGYGEWLYALRATLS